MFLSQQTNCLSFRNTVLWREGVFLFFYGEPSLKLFLYNSTRVDEGKVQFFNVRRERKPLNKKKIFKETTVHVWYKSQITKFYQNDISFTFVDTPYLLDN